MSDVKKSTFKMNRRAVLISGGVTLFCSLYLLVFLVPDLIKSLGGPESMTIERAEEVASGTSTYVKLNNAEWNCNSIDYIYGTPSSGNRLRRIIKFTRVLATNSRHDTIMWVELSGEYDCDDLQNEEITGYLSRSGGNAELCGFCGPENSAIGVGFGTVIFLAGIGLLAWGYRLPPASKTPDPLQNTPSSPINPPDI